MNQNLTVVKEKLGKRYLQAATVATVAAFPLVARAEGESPITPDVVKSTIDGLGMPALIGAVVVGMLTVAVLIWGGRKVVGFFSK
ncbi:hypothetical protein R4646_17745 [Acinetobacter baumannii]|uniref:hypothetical protein n=1 Tax=Acinetobacter baumannii TaxID=470 RepID=UPI0024487562|nr:hypothetical protein [Acinetobacter baumannii]MDH2648683.1 hypothetical protein [Acinetobacter baumannii]MDV7648783.1 hypothetical protein [Acinetobacter baumannii]MDV7648792.1 hypothetical protein [Acinetobacter baumannii]MDV7648801.1 hypothetical protein [Acinetobacter baumannii]